MGAAVLELGRAVLTVGAVLGAVFLFTAVLVLADRGNAGGLEEG